MYQQRLSPDHTRLIMDLHRLEMSNVDIARTLGITEGAVRYRLKQAASPTPDGRARRLSQVAPYRSIVADWVAEYHKARHRPTLRTLYETLRDFHGFSGSYDAVRRYIRKHFPAFHKKCARLRIETPPGVLMQLDWKENLQVQLERPGHWRTVHALCGSLSFSRKTAVRLLDQKTLAAWIHGQQELFRQLGGLPTCVRVDCLRSAVVRWTGEQSVLNATYERYMTDLGIQVFPSRPGTPRDKGKIEKRIQDIFRRLDLAHRVFPSLQAFQTTIDANLTTWEGQWRSGATGLPVDESFAYERAMLRPLPDHFPVLPLQEARTTVRRDGTVAFAGNYYQVPQVYQDKTVLCLHTGQAIQIYYRGTLIGDFAHIPGTKGMVRLQPTALQTTTLPLSDTVRAWAVEVAERQVDIYHTMITRRTT
jgi:transposase